MGWVTSLTRWCRAFYSACKSQHHFAVQALHSKTLSTSGGSTVLPVVQSPRRLYLFSLNRDTPRYPQVWHAKVRVQIPGETFISTLIIYDSSCTGGHFKLWIGSSRLLETVYLSLLCSRPSSSPLLSPRPGYVYVFTGRGGRKKKKKLDLLFRFLKYRREKKKKKKHFKIFVTLKDTWPRFFPSIL